MISKAILVLMHFGGCANQLQVKAAYYAALDGMNANFLNLALQFRLTPLMQVFVGTRSVMDFTRQLEMNLYPLKWI